MTRAPWILLFLTLVASSNAAAQTDQTQTVINGVTLTAQQKTEFVRIYGTPPLAGSFWYDTRSGLWGVNGREAFGVLRPGHDFGQLSPAASRGTTGVFINGRQINMTEALYIRNLLGAVVPGRWWLDGATGYFGVEGSTAPTGNLYLTARAAQARSGGGGAHYYNDGMGTSVATSAGCTTGSTGTGSSRTDFIIGCE